MAARGRPPKPANLKLLQGNPGKRSLGKGLPEPEALRETPPPPAFLGDLGDWAVEAWETVAPWLTQVGILTATDTHNLEVFCAAYQRWRDASHQLATDGLTITDAKGNLKKHPASTVLNDAARQMATFGGVLGLDPAARQRLVSGGGSQPKQNPFLLLKGGNRAK